MSLNLLVGIMKKIDDQKQTRELSEEGGLNDAQVPTQRRRLFELMEKHSLTAKAAGELLGRSERTVLIWRCQGGKEIPLPMLELLELKLDNGLSSA